MNLSFWIRVCLTVLTGVFAYLAAYKEVWKEKYAREKEPKKIHWVIRFSPFALSIATAIAAIIIDAMNTQQTETDARIRMIREKAIQSGIDSSLSSLQRLSLEQRGLNAKLENQGLNDSIRFGRNVGSLSSISGDLHKTSQRLTNELFKMNYPIERISVHLVLGFPLKELDTTASMDARCIRKFEAQDKAGQQRPFFSYVDFERQKYDEHPELFSFVMHQIGDIHRLMFTIVDAATNQNSNDFIQYKIAPLDDRDYYRIAFQQDTAFVYFNVKGWRIINRHQSDYVPSIESLIQKKFYVSVEVMNEYTHVEDGRITPNFFLWGGMVIVFGDGKMALEYDSKEITLERPIPGDTIKNFKVFNFVTPPLRDYRKRVPTANGTDDYGEGFTTPTARLYCNSNRPVVDYVNYLIIRDRHVSFQK